MEGAMSRTVHAEILKQSALESFLCEVNLLLALFKIGRKEYLLKEGEIIDKAISFLSQAIRGFHNYRETQKNQKYTLTKEAITADTAYRKVLIILDNRNEVEALLSEYIETLEKTKTGDDINPEKIDSTIKFFGAIASKTRENYCRYIETPIGFPSTHISYISK